MSENRYDLGEDGTLPQIKLTKEMIKALGHAATSKEMYAVGFAAADEALAEELHPGDRALTIEAYLDEENGGTPLLVNYAWNHEGSGAWLEPDGGWHYQPCEAGYYPWKTDDHEYVLGLTKTQTRDLLASIETVRNMVENSEIRGRLTALLDSLWAQAGATSESELMVVHDQIGHPLQVGNIVSDSNNTGWLISEIQIRDRSEDPCGYVVGDHNDLTDIFPIRYTDGGAMCFGVRFIREAL